MEVMSFHVSSNDINDYHITLNSIENRLFYYEIKYTNNEDTDIVIGDVEMIEGDLYFSFNHYINNDIINMAKKVIMNEVF